MHQTVKRIGWIDLARGAAILLVIIGHTLGETPKGIALNNVIYSFHMPLFFLLSMAVFRCSETIDEWKRSVGKSAKRLLVPVLFIKALVVLAKVVKEPYLIRSFTFLRSHFYSLLFSSGVWLSYEGVEIPELGAAWFLVVLFLGRALFDYLQLSFKKRQLRVICLLFWLIGVLYGQRQKLVFSLDIVLAVQPFFYAGTVVKSFVEEHTNRKWFLCLLGIYLLTLFVEIPNPTLFTALQISARNYSLTPLSYVTALCGSVLLCMVAKGMQDWNVCIPFRQIGKASMDLFVIHCLDFPAKRFWYVQGSVIQSVLFRLGWNLAVFVIVQLLRKVFSEYKVKSST